MHRSQGIVGDRLFMLDAAATLPMLVAVALMWATFAQQHRLQIQPDYML